MEIIKNGSIVYFCDGCGRVVKPEQGMSSWVEGDWVTDEDGEEHFVPSHPREHIVIHTFDECRRRLALIASQATLEGM